MAFGGTYDRRAVGSWALYDFANSPFTTLVVTFIYSTYFTKAFAAGHYLERLQAELLEREGQGLDAAQQAALLEEHGTITLAEALEPAIVLADEPTANVDPISAENVLDLIRTTCREENVSLLTVTHDMEIASKFDRIEKLDETNRAYAAAAST